MKPTQTHTPGALRAARKVYAQFVPPMNHTAENLGALAGIIDAETHAPELLGALKQLEWAHSQLLADRGCIDSILSEERFQDVIHAGEIARAAIARATGQP